MLFINNTLNLAGRVGVGQNKVYGIVKMMATANLD
jgi:hypothetical protein